ncbi:MAG: DUF3618 domain-containing protein [Vicinamibacterales bacterium]
MDDRSTGVGGERTSGRGEEYMSGRASEPAPRRNQESPANWEDNRRDADAPPSDPRARQIRADIERTRGDMSETIEAIQDRLRPSTIASNTAANVRDAASARMRDVADSEMVQDLRANPIPAAMVGIGVLGLAWMAFGGRDDQHRMSSYRGGARRDRRSSGGRFDSGNYYRGSQWRDESPVQTFPHESGSQGIYDLQGRGASEEGYTAGVARTARQTTRRAQNQLQRMVRENPLAVGAAAAVIGAAIGLALPETDRENELMGDARDNVVDTVQNKARDAAGRVQDAATNAVQNAASNVVKAVTDNRT